MDAIHDLIDKPKREPNTHNHLYTYAFDNHSNNAVESVKVVFKSSLEKLNRFKKSRIIYEIRSTKARIGNFRENNNYKVTKIIC